MLELEKFEFEIPNYMETVETFGVEGFPEISGLSIAELDVLQADVMQRLEESRNAPTGISWMSSELSKEAKKELDDVMKLSPEELDAMQAQVLQNLSRAQSNFQKHLSAISRKR